MKVACPHCGWPSYFDFVFYERSYYHCANCDLIFCRCDKSVKETIDYYKVKYFDDHAQDQLSGSRNKIFKHALNMIERFIPPGELLDVGCGIGQLVKEAIDRGWKALGVDPSEKSIAHARKLAGDNFICGTLDEVKERERFDCVTMINVLDHMVDGGRQLKKIYRLLKKDGIIYLRVPNGYFYAGLRRWAAKRKFANAINRYLVFHEYVLTPKALKNCLAGYGYKDVTITGDKLSNLDCRQSIMISSLIFSLLLKIFSWGTKVIEVVSKGKVILSPSISVMAWKK